MKTRFLFLFIINFLFWLFTLYFYNDLPIDNLFSFFLLYSSLFLLYSYLKLIQFDIRVRLVTIKLEIYIINLKENISLDSYHKLSSLSLEFDTLTNQLKHDNI